MTKKESAMIQGLAILLMEYHHLFAVPGSLPVGVTPLIGETAETTAAVFAKICVALYAFVTGYGILRSSLAAKKESFAATVRSVYKAALFRALRFLFLYWYVVVIYFLIARCFLGVPLTLQDLVLNLLTVSTSINGSWWYAAEYLLLVFFLPLPALLFMFFDAPGENRRKNIWMAAILLLLAALLVLLRKNHVDLTLDGHLVLSYFLTALSGAVTAELHLFERIRDHIQRPAAGAVTGAALVVLCFAARTAVTVDASFARYDFLFAPMLILGVLLLSKGRKTPERVLCFFGKYSVYMWLSHLLFLTGPLQKLIFLFPVSIWVYGSLVVCSLLFSMLLSRGYRLIAGKAGLKYET